jgi:hypothetical protein
MTIKYADGRKGEAILLSRTDDDMRVMVKGSDDATDLMLVNGNWYAGREPVEVEFAWQSRARAAAPALTDCVCSAELAAQLIDMALAHSRVVDSKPLRHFSAGSQVN